MKNQQETSLRAYKVYCAAVRDPASGTSAWAAILEENRTDPRVFVGLLGTQDTPQAELTSVIEALRKTPEGAQVQLSCVSRVVIEGLREHIKTWDRKGWKTAKGTPVAHAALWQTLQNLDRHRQVQVRWIKNVTEHPRCAEVFDRARDHLRSVVTM